MGGDFTDFFNRGMELKSGQKTNRSFGNQVHHGRVPLEEERLAAKGKSGASERKACHRLLALKFVPMMDRDHPPPHKYHQEIAKEFLFVR